MNHKYNAPEGFASRLQQTILDSGKTITEISKESCIARSSAYYYCYNNTPPNITNFARLCKTLDVSADYLLFGGGCAKQDRQVN